MTPAAVAPVGVRRAIDAATLLVLVGLATAAGGQSGNPFEGDSEAIRAGRPLFEARCADCHSADARGIRGPDLTGLWANGRSDASIFTTVRSGVPGTIMPPSQAPDDELWAVIAYLRDISTVPPFSVPGADPDRGRALFERECQRCHLVDGHGGALGPNLSRIALSRSRESLERSIRDPDDTIESGFRAISLETTDGRRIEGIVKAEDAFSIQIIDSDQRLSGYDLSQLSMVVREERSLMPRFGRRNLDQSELDDVLAFLATLRGDPVLDTRSPTQ